MSISISRHIYAKLSGSDALTKIVSDKIFPISTRCETTFPFIIYKRNALTPNYTKDRHSIGDSVTAEIVIADDNYFNSVAVAQLVRDVLENKRGEYEDFDVIDARLISADEDFIEDTFIQRLTFSFETE